MTSFNFRDLQREQAPWVKHNFGDRPPYMPLLGMLEEVGEYMEASAHKRRSGMVDAIGDMAIFFSDYCTSKGFDSQVIYENASATVVDALVSGSLDVTSLLEFPGNERHAYHALSLIGHHQLKSDQRIRGTSEEHDRMIIVGLSLFVLSLEHLSKENAIDLLDTVEDTWNFVKKRDFKANSKDGTPK